MRTYQPTFFKPQELVPRATYKLLKQKGKLHRLWYFFDPRILWTGDALRERYGKMIVNDWAWGGDNQYRGWRPWECKVGSWMSQHKFGRALDLDPLDISAEEIRQDMRAHPDLEVFQFLTCVEDNVGWLHGDCRNWGQKQSGIVFINP